MLLNVFLAALAAQPSPAEGAEPQAHVPQIAAGEALRAEIHAVDAEYFRLLWRDCEPAEKLAAFLHSEGEFYHDVNGYRKDSAASIRSMTRRCERAAKTGERTRRELVEGSFSVDPVPRFGAIATGEHRFYRTAKGEAEQLIGTARFLILYKREPDGWKGYRAFSFAHRAADAPR